MKRFPSLFFLCALTFYLSACCGVSALSEAESTAAHGGTALPSVVVQDLYNHSYVLVSVNGEVLGLGERAPSLDFDSTLRVSGRVCNQFMGQGVLGDNVLTISQMASTRMMCGDNQLNILEDEFFRMVVNGAHIEMDASTLSLSRDGKIFVYKLIEMR